MKKAILLIIIIVIVVSLLTIGIIKLFNQGYLYIGDVWCDTPEEALSLKCEDPWENPKDFTIKKLLQKINIDDIVEITFVSDNDTLITADFVTNEKGQYAFHGYTKEESLSSPTGFILNGEEDQFILIPYNQYNTTIFGWCYSNVSVTVDGITPSTKTYVFECQGKEWSIDYWWIDDFDFPEDEYEDVSLECSFK